MSQSCLWAKLALVATVILTVSVPANAAKDPVRHDIGYKAKLTAEVKTAGRSLLVARCVIGKASSDAWGPAGYYFDSGIEFPGTKFHTGEVLRFSIVVEAGETIPDKTVLEPGSFIVLAAGKKLPIVRIVDIGGQEQPANQIADPTALTVEAQLARQRTAAVDRKVDTAVAKANEAKDTAASVKVETVKAVQKLLDSYGLDNLKTDVGALKTDVRALKEDVTGIKDDIRNLKDEVEKLKKAGQAAANPPTQQSEPPDYIRVTGFCGSWIAHEGWIYVRVDGTLFRRSHKQ